MAPATQHGFDEEPLPDAVVLDADFVVSVLHEGEEFHEECTAFAGRLFRGSVPIVYSQLLRLEFLSGWRSAMNRRGFPPGLVRQGRLIADPQSQREALYRLGDEFLLDFLRLFDRYEVRLSARLQDRALGFMGRFNLKPMDACLVACAFQSDVPHIASLDRDFRRVDDVHLWNDHIPSRR